MGGALSKVDQLTLCQKKKQLPSLRERVHREFVKKENEDRTVRSCRDKKKKKLQPLSNFEKTVSLFTRGAAGT